MFERDLLLRGGRGGEGKGRESMGGTGGERREGKWEGLSSSKNSLTYALREVGRGYGVVDLDLEMTDVSRGGDRGRNQVGRCFEKLIWYSG